jgi:hypothetical protein
MSKLLSPEDHKDLSFLTLNAINLFIPGDEDNILAAEIKFRSAGLRPVRHNISAVRVARVNGQDLKYEGEFLAIAGLGAGTEKRTLDCIEELGISDLNEPLIWATTSLIYYDIRGT